MYEELDYRETPQGALVLRRHRALSLDGEMVHEVTLDGEFLMSSLVDASERALATRALDALGERAAHVLVGGLGLGATADAALALDSVRSLDVIEFSPVVIDWHRRALVPLGARLAGDPRVTLIEGDFFADLANDRAWPRERYSALLIDIDHSPTSRLHPSHASLYTPAGLARAAARLEPGGVFAYWSADPPDAAFLELMQEVFASVEAVEIEFINPLVGEEDRNTIYLGKKKG